MKALLTIVFSCVACSLVGQNVAIEFLAGNRTSPNLENTPLEERYRNTGQLGEDGMIYFRFDERYHKMNPNSGIIEELSQNISGISTISPSGKIFKADGNRLYQYDVENDMFQMVYEHVMPFGTMLAVKDDGLYFIDFDETSVYYLDLSQGELTLIFSQAQEYCDETERDIYWIYDLTYDYKNEVLYFSHDGEVHGYDVKSGCTQIVRKFVETYFAVAPNGDLVVAENDWIEEELRDYVIDRITGEAVGSVQDLIGPTIGINPCTNEAPITVRVQSDANHNLLFSFTVPERNIFVSSSGTSVIPVNRSLRTDNRPATDALLGDAAFIDLDNENNLFISDNRFRSNIRKIDSDGMIKTVLSGRSKELENIEHCLGEITATWFSPNDNLFYVAFFDRLPNQPEGKRSLAILFDTGEIEDIVNYGLGQRIRGIVNDPVNDQLLLLDNGSLITESRVPAFDELESYSIERAAVFENSIYFIGENSGGLLTGRFDIESRTVSTYDSQLNIDGSRRIRALNENQILISTLSRIYLVDIAEPRINVVLNMFDYPEIVNQPESISSSISDFDIDDKGAIVVENNGLIYRFTVEGISRNEDEQEKEGDNDDVVFTLVDSRTNLDLKPLKKADYWFLSDSRNLNVRADFGNDVTVGSVHFDVNGRSRIENQPPYALAGDNGGDYFQWDADRGEYTICATPFSGKGLSGVKGKEECIDLSLIFTLPDTLGGSGELFAKKGSFLWQPEVSGPVSYWFSMVHEDRSWGQSLEVMFPDQTLSFFPTGDFHYNQRTSRATIFSEGMINGVEGYILRLGLVYRSNSTLARITITEVANGEIIFDTEREMEVYDRPTQVVKNAKGFVGTPSRAEINAEDLNDLLTANELAIYPNPFTNRITLELPASEDLVEISIVDLQGRLMLTEYLEGGRVHEVNTTGLASGVYILRVEMGEEVESVRVVKE